MLGEPFACVRAWRSVGQTRAAALWQHIADGDLTSQAWTLLHEPLHHGPSVADSHLHTAVY